MNYQKLLKTIRQHTWWEEKSPMVYQFVMYPLHCFVEQCRYFHPKYLSLSVFMSTPGDFFHELTPQDEKSRVYWYIYKQIARNPKYLVNKRRTGDRNKAFVQVGRRFERTASALSNRQIWRSYRQFLEYYLDYTRYVVMGECVDVFTQYELEGLVRKELPQLPADQVREITRVMATPAHLSFMEHEHERILELALDWRDRIKRFPGTVFKDIDTRRQQPFRKLSGKYFWTNNSYATVIRLTAEDFFNQMKGEAKGKPASALRLELRSLRSKVKRLSAEHRRLYKKYRFSQDLLRHFRLVQFFGAWIDNRKSFMMQGSHYLEQYCQELARRFSIPVRDVRYYLPVDFKNLLLHGRRLDKKTIIARQTLSAYVIEKRGNKAVPTIYYGRQARKIFSTIQSRFQVKKGQVIGQVASAPVKKFSGTVQVVKDSHKEKFVAGRILVASMTRPDFVPLMRQARAIITDEGGLTCHAAIVARELKIPCIIGTKNATVEFKTGQRVMMDLETGFIKKS